MVLFAVVGLLFPAAVATAAQPTQLEASVEQRGSSRQLSVTGSLRSSGEPVARADVHLLLGSTSLGSTTTNQQGQFRLNVALHESIGGGQHTITVGFNGAGELDPSSTTVSVTLDGPPASPPETAPAQPTTTAPPPDTRANAAPTLSVHPTEASAGDLLTLTGRVTAADQPLASVAVRFSIGGEDSPGSLTHTGDNGSYSTFIEVPPDQAPGQVDVRVAVAEGRTHKAGSSKVTITVREPVAASAEPTPTLEDPGPTQDPTPTATPTVEATATASAPVEETDDEPTTAIAPSPLSWFLIALVVVGGSALLVTIALLMRRNLAADPRDATETVFLLDADSWDDDAWHDLPDDDTVDVTDIDDGGPPPADPRPRRSLPADD